MTDKQLVLPDSFRASGALAEKYKSLPQENLGEGIKSGFGIIGYRGKVWSTKYQGNEKTMMREDGDGPKASIELVIVKASPHISKIYYEAGFVDGSVAPPDCWSADGLKPDAGAPKKQSPTCAGCAKNAWGSKVTDAGKATKACADSKRLAVVPLGDLKNELMGGPMLLRVPAATLRDLKAYGDQMQAYGYPYYAVGTRIAFDVQEAFPKFVLTPIRQLTEAEFNTVMELRDGPIVTSILSETVEAAHTPDAATPAIPTSIFEQPHLADAKAATPTPAAAAPVTPTPQVTPTAAPAGSPAPVTPEEPKSTRAPRRTKEQMAAAAAEREAARKGGTAPAAATQATPATPAAGDAPAPAAETASAGAAFESQLDALLS
jgi:hypothetical protein